MPEAMTDVVLLQLPSPPRQNVFREWSGGMGTALPSSRTVYGHDQQYYDIPFSGFLYIARQLEIFGIEHKYKDYQALSIFDEESYISFLIEENPKILVTVVNIPSYSGDFYLLRKATKAVPGLRIVLIGPTAKWYKEQILSQGDASVIMEEGEELFVAENIKEMLSGTNDLSLQACSVYNDGRVETLKPKSVMKDLSFVDFPAYDLRWSRKIGQAAKVYSTG